jgi:SPOR domain
MVVKRRRSGARNWARGVFAFFWIVLGGVSGLYLFDLFTNPEALGEIQLGALTGDEPAPNAAPEAPGSTEPSPISKAEVVKLKQSLRVLSEKLAEVNARLKPIEKFIGPVAALPPAASVSTNIPPVMPEASVASSEPAAAPEEQPAPPPAEPAAAKPPEPAPKPVETAKATPAPAAAAPEPETQAAPAEEAEAPGPQPVAVAPMEDEFKPAGNASASATADQTQTHPAEIAKLDPVALPPAANDGSTRYGIEIGTVAKADQLRPLWREYLTNHAALVAGLQPRRVLAPDKKWRLIAGPFANAQEAEGACTLFKKADRPCAATVFAGDTL